MQPIKNVASLFGLFNTDFAPAHILTVEDIHRRLGFTGFGHLDKAKALGNTGLFVHDQGAGLHCAVSSEHSPKFFFCSGAGEIAYQ